MDNLSRRKKNLLFIATLTPLAFATIWAAVIVIGIIATGAFMNPDGGTPPAYQAFHYAMMALVVLWQIGLFVLYLIHLIGTERIPKDLKALWGVILFLGGIVAMGIYWYMFIWREPAPQT